MKKKIVMVCVITAISALILTGCCDHKWVEASCKEPKTCAECGKTEGEPTKDHTWTKATCIEPKTCKICGMTEGEPTGHNWEEATCTEPKTCSVCKETEGKAEGHNWEEATCTKAKSCSVCGETQGLALGHDIKEWNVTKEATCTEEGRESGECTVCKKTIDKNIDKTEHTPGDWQVTEEATWNIPGTRTKSCTVCGEVLETEEYELSEEEKESIFKSTCQAFSYDQIARDPDSYMLEHGVYTGKVVQVIENTDGSIGYRVNITPTSWGGYEDTIYVSCFKYVVDRMSMRILEDDIVTIWGYNYGLISYTTVMGAELTIPVVIAEYIEVVG